MHKLRYSAVPPILLGAWLLAGAALGMGPRRSGGLDVTTHPEGAVVVCDGKDYGAGPVTLPGVGQGTHLLVARKDGFHEARRTVSLLEGQQMAVDLKLEPADLVVDTAIPCGLIVNELVSYSIISDNQSIPVFADL